MISTIAVGTDGSETASKAVDVAVEMARRFEARVVLMSVYRDEPAAADKVDEREWAWNPAAQIREILARTEARLKVDEGIDCVTRTGKGNPAKALVKIADECGADLLVIGNKGHGPPRARQRSELSGPQRSLLGLGGQDHLGPGSKSDRLNTGVRIGERNSQRHIERHRRAVNSVLLSDLDHRLEIASA